MHYDAMTEGDERNRDDTTSGVRILVYADGANTTTLLSAFLADNIDDPDTCEAVNALKPGESVTLGGGACPDVVVTRFIDGE